MTDREYELVEEIYQLTYDRQTTAAIKVAYLASKLLGIDAKHMAAIAMTDYH